MPTLFLKGGLITTPDYEAFKFPGGELHLKLTNKFLSGLGRDGEVVMIKCRLNTSDDLVLLIQAIFIIAELRRRIEVTIGYLAYQQADDKFSQGESFTLKYIAHILNSLPVETYYIYDPHSLAVCAINKAVKIDNRQFVSHVLMTMFMIDNGNVGFADYQKNHLTILSPDAGAYKKIFKLAEVVKFDGQIETANKYRDQLSGGLNTRLSCHDFHGKDVLIIDDICVGGLTFVHLAKELKKRNVHRLFLCISHGVFNNREGNFSFGELEDNFHTIFVTNTRAEEYASAQVHVFKIL